MTMPPPRLQRVLLVCSSGGHLAQLHRLAPWWGAQDRAWVTFRKPDAESVLTDERVWWAFHPTTRHARNLVRNAWLAWRVLRIERPDVVVSNGAGVAVPFFVFARLLRVPTVYVEVYDRIDSATVTARLCRPFTSLFCVQWPEQQRFYPGSVVVGRFL